VPASGRVLQSASIKPISRVMGRPRNGKDSGAAAVEFALVVPVLLMILFGIIDYGLLFNNSLSVKQGVREAARQGVVANYGSSCSMTWSTLPSTNMQKLGCTIVDRTSAVSGTTYVKIKIPAGWVKGQSLIVCEMVKTSGVTGLTPMPSSGVVTGKVEMSIEKATVGQVEAGGEQAPPSGASWSWC
jgi:Flp pilus assembly protein TadG